MNHMTFEWQTFKRQALVSTIVVTSLLSIIYCLYLLFFVFGSLVEKFLGFLLLLLVAVSAVFNIAGCHYYLRSRKLRALSSLKPLTNFPRVAVLIPARNESFADVQQTLNSLKTLEYPSNKLQFYLIDNSDIPNRQIENFVHQTGFNYLYIENKPKLKSYVLNKALEQIDCDYVTIFDADETLVNPKFLLELLPHLEADKTLASIQSYKKYADGNFFANAVNSYYSFFYNFIQPVRSDENCAIFSGSLGIIRKSVLDKLGGFPNSPTEDAAFSFKADLLGFGGKYVHKVYALGKPIERFSAFLAQQLRYTCGNTSLIGEYLANIGKIPLNKQLHYLMQLFSFAYLSLNSLLYALLTMAFVMSNLIVTIMSGPLQFSGAAHLSAVIYLFGIIAVTLLGSRLFFGSIKMGLTAILINFSMAIPRGKAIIATLQGVPTPFVMTREKEKPIKLSKAVHHTYKEALLAVSFFALSAISIARLDFVGAVWLIIYAWFFAAAPIFALFTDARLA